MGSFVVAGVRVLGIVICQKIEDHWNYSYKKLGRGCGGRIHSRGGWCARCSRREGRLPLWSKLRAVGNLAVMEVPLWARRLEGVAGGILVAACALLWRQGSSFLAILMWCPLGLGLLYHALFTRRAVVVDGGGRAFIESARALFRARRDRIRSFDEIAFIGLDCFRDQKIVNGLLVSHEPRSNVWIQWTDGGVRSFGSGAPVAAARLAERLQALTDAPLRMIRLQDSPTRDRWFLRDATGDGWGP